MPRRLTTEEFIAKGEATYGDRFDYSLTIYEHSETDVTVICRVPGHGAFPVTPHYHLRKRRNGGCPHCNSTKPLTREEFIAKAMAKHDDRYDYSLVEYVNSQTRVKIICPVHGVFPQIPNDHLSGKGCKKCGRIAMKQKQRMTQEEFIAKAIAKHDDRYNYSLVEYVNSDTEVKIICFIHGDFKQMPEKHLALQGCKKCGEIAAGLKQRSNTKEFIQKARAIHGDLYDYSQVEYVTSAKKIKIGCPIHKVFRQTPSSHLSGSGCDKCAPNKKLTNVIFIKRATAIHDDRYDYSLAEYINAHTEVWIICPDHKSFPITPSNHLYGRKGCPDCADFGFNPSDPALLYYIAITTEDSDTRYKIGVSNNFERRYFGADVPRIRIVKTWQYAIGRAAREREREILKQYVGDRYHGPDILVGTGNTELFTHDVLGLDQDT